MLTFVLCVLGLWCLYNTISIKMNKIDDTRGQMFDKMNLKVLQIHNQRLDRIEKIIKEMGEKDN